MPRDREDAADANHSLRAHRSHGDVVPRRHLADPRNHPRIGEIGVCDGIAGPGKRLPPRQQDVFSVSEQRRPLAVGQVGEDTVCQGTDGPYSR